MTIGTLFSIDGLNAIWISGQKKSQGMQPEAGLDVKKNPMEKGGNNFAKKFCRVGRGLINLQSDFGVQGGLAKKVGAEFGEAG